MRTMSLLLALLFASTAHADWVLAAPNANCNTACQSVSGSCLTAPMNGIDTPEEVYAIDGEAGITCVAVEDLSLTTAETTFTTLPRLEIRPSNTNLCQFSRSGLQADCSDVPEENGLRRICCCGNSNSDCDASVDPENNDPENNDQGGSNFKLIAATIGGIIGLILAVLGVFAGIFGAGVWAGTELFGSDD